MGQRKADGKLHKRSHLNKPPTILLNAMKLLRSDHPFGRGEMNRYIAYFAQLSERLEVFQAYRHPGRNNDFLYQVDYDHKDGEDCRNCDANLAETRAARKSDAPVVHYGLIASGNAVIKDPRYRDELRRAWDVTCFEMEAAGLMDNFPCLVIRGISDYCDTHKQKRYLAAVCGSDSCRICQRPASCDSPTGSSCSQSRGNERRLAVLDALSRIQTGISSIKSSITVAQESELLVWLSSKDYGPEQTDTLSQRQEGKGTWLLEITEFQNWESESNKTIYCRGIPGAGKTVMTAVVVDHLRSTFQDNPAVGIACIYCSAQNKTEQSCNGIFLSLLRQLTRQLSYTPEMVKRMYDRHTRAGDRPSFHETVDALQDTISRFRRTFIVVDALDELVNSTSSPKQLIREISALQEKSRVNVFATSRLVPEISGEFKQSTLVDIRATEEDVARFLDSHIKELPAFVAETPGLESEIKTGIISTTDGMLVCHERVFYGKEVNGAYRFLLAKLHLTLFRSKVSISDVKGTIKNLSRGFDGYDKLYLETMNNVQSQNQGLRELAIKALSWICCSRRLLLAAELRMR
ncbi:hypothetical protein BJX61DRAFT_125537 [Aspergillus egyptiacus]|nr:hypothetical protein BJX61DRAFT_125537 [Aspergillus egyptiacus]